MTRIRRWQVLERLIEEHGWTRGVEVGVHRGRTFKHVLTACPKLTMVGVDRWDTAYFQATRKGRPPKEIDLEADYAALKAWLGGTIMSKRALLVKDDTVAAAAKFCDGAFDFAFIDADHRYEAVKADIEAWRPKARVICGHDYNPQEFPGVVRAVDEAFYRLQTFDDHVWMGVDGWGNPG